MPTLEINGQRIRFRHQPHPSATAPVALLLHMAGASSLAWSAVLRQLEGHAEGVAPDLPGHGQSEGEPLESVAAMADFAAALLDALGVQQAHVAGHSMGGAVALQLALAQPARVRSLLLVSTGARLDIGPQLWAAVGGQLDHAATRFAGLARGTSPRGARIEPIFPQTSRLGIDRDFAACAAFDLATELGRIPHPAAVMVGRDDRLTPLSLAQRLAAGLPRARLLVEEEAGHLLPRERPAAVAKALISLVSSAGHDYSTRGLNRPRDLGY